MKKYIKHILLIVVSTSLLLSAGCSVFMASKQPSKKDVGLFKVGIPRGLLLAEFGSPIHTEQKDGKRVEIFKFVQGYSAGAKAGRAVFHGAADVFTLGLWEVVGTPTEGAFSGDDIAYQVTYDKDDRIAEILALKTKK